MAAEGNGQGTESGHKGLNGQAAGPKSRTRKEEKGFGLLSIIFRLLTWYSILTLLFRCPATIDLVTDSSPKICKPYFHVRSVVAPHLQPYYEVYAAPYVDAARPYYDTLNQRVITPVTVLGTKYGAPRVAQAQAYGQAQWEKNLQPQVVKYQRIATEQYDQHLEPHLERVTTALAPYYDIARTIALQTYYEYILPTYTTVQPYALQGYSIASDFTLNTAIPYSQWALTTGGTFLDRTVFPKLRILYGENVEPQLVRIGERLGRYRDGKKLKTVIDEIESSSSVSSVSSSISAVSASISSSHAQTTPGSATKVDTAVTSTETVAETTPLSEKEIREKAQKVVAEDLKTWQENFAKAADEGSEYLEEHITEITDRLIKNQAEKVGAALNIRLEETITSSFENLKSAIISIVETSEDSQKGEELIRAAVRRAGVGIKEKAQAVRTWRSSYDRETTSLISKSAEDTFEILDHIRDLGLQEIGMRWAWIDGVTHKDWAKYHKLKTKFDEWRLDVEKVVSEHEGVAKARAASEDVESKAMGAAEDAAKELARLKEVGRWKLSTGDTSDDWSTKSMPAAAAGVGQKIKEKLSEASEAIIGNSQRPVESVSSAASSSNADAASQASNAGSAASEFTESVSSVASSVSSSVFSTQKGSVESVISVGTSSVSSIADQISSAVIGTQQGSVESVTSVAEASASSIVDQASSSIIGKLQGVSDATKEASSLAARASSSVVGTAPGAAAEASSSVESAAPLISDSASSLADNARSSVSSASSRASDGASGASSLADSALSPAVSSASNIASDASSSLSSEASEASSTASKKVWGGAVAQSVEGKKIVLDDVVEDRDENSFSEKIQSLASEAGDKFADVTKAVSEALHRPTATGGAVETVTVLAAEQYSSAFHAASVALYGTQQGAGESVASVVSSRYADAVSAASAVIFGTSTPLTDSLGTQDSGIYGTPQRAFESVSSVAASMLSEGLSTASSLFEEGKSYVNAAPTGSSEQQKLLAQLQDQYYGGVGFAHARYSEFIAAASSVIPTKAPTPWTEPVASAASSNWEALITKASSQIYGQPTPHFVTRHLSEAREYAMSVTDNVASQYSSVQSLISELVSGKEPDFTQSVYSRLSSAYYTGAADISSSASSYASEAYASATSVISSVFTPPPAIEVILEVASSRVNDAVEAASIQFYGTPKGAYEQASSSATSAYSAIQSVVSEKVYGSQTGYAEAAQSSIAAAASSARRAISEAIYGTPTGAFESATSVAGEAYSKASSAVSSAIYGPEQGAVESAQKRLGDAVESARVKLAAFASAAAAAASEAASNASEGVEHLASSISSAVDSATSQIKDEL